MTWKAFGSRLLGKDVPILGLLNYPYGKFDRTLVYRGIGLKVIAFDPHYYRIEDRGDKPFKFAVRVILQAKYSPRTSTVYGDDDGIDSSGRPVPDTRVPISISDEEYPKGDTLVGIPAPLEEISK